MHMLKTDQLFFQILKALIVQAVIFQLGLRIILTLEIAF